MPAKYSLTDEGRDLTLKLSEKSYSTTKQTSNDEEPTVIIAKKAKNKKNDESQTNHFKSQPTARKMSSSSDSESDDCLIIPANDDSNFSIQLKSIEHIKSLSIETFEKPNEDDPFILLNSSSDTESNEDFCIIPISSSNTKEVVQLQESNFNLKKTNFELKSREVSVQNTASNHTYQISQSQILSISQSHQISSTKNFNSDDILKILMPGTYEIILVVDTCETSHA